LLADGDGGVING